MKRFACIVLALSSTWHGHAVAQSYPLRAITFVVPYPAGGATDVIARGWAAPIRRLEPVHHHRQQGRGQHADWRKLRGQVPA
jgi:hypothetical protein